MDSELGIDSAIKEVEALSAAWKEPSVRGTTSFYDRELLRKPQRVEGNHCLLKGTRFSRDADESED